MNLLTLSNTKTLKGQKRGYMTFILHLSPANISGWNVCKYASKGCKEACLNTAGRGIMRPVQAGRLRKTKLFFENRPEFMRQLVRDIEAGIRKAAREGMEPVFRLNGTSDIPWERVKLEGFRNIFERFSAVQFYDYTAYPKRGNLPSNYHLTFSRKEDNEKQALQSGLNIAAVFSGKTLPRTYKGLPVINGDESDLRFLDPQGVIVGLTAKGKAKKDRSGFVIQGGTK